MKGVRKTTVTSLSRDKERLLGEPGSHDEATPGGRSGKIMTKQLHYGVTAKVFHWLLVALLLVQYPLGKFMPDIHRGMKPGDAMTLHISIGITILAFMALRFFWRITHPVALRAWQQQISDAVHWLFYVLVLDDDDGLELCI
jgi:Prokaryotic cytochrome b561